ncbi:unnamed protein product [Paramecium octaurelia]|uniref:ERCC1-like central domain-containing protein n=1 Tax=Paramecium octaurelia TaxID=43137 RepID=A0A8S1WHU7_PAROT|nr:unnamed protein product [Paramecium octaurelia]
MIISQNLINKYSYFKQLDKLYQIQDVKSDFTIESRKLHIIFMTLSYHQGHPHDIISRIQDVQQFPYQLLLLLHLDIKDEFNYLMDLQMTLIPYKCKLIILWTQNEVIDFFKRTAELK